MTRHLEILNREFQKRISRNARYSLRAYAKFLGLHSSALSRVLAGKLLLTPAKGVHIAGKLKLSSDESRIFLRSIFEAREHAEMKRIGPIGEVPSLRPSVKKISQELHHHVATLKALSILQLTYVENFESTPAYVSSRLGFSVQEAEVMMALLLDIGLLKRDELGVLTSVDLHMTTVENEETNEVRRKLQAEILKRSLQSLNNDDFAQRLHYGMTMAIDPAKLQLAREKLMSFMELLADELGSASPTRVYQLALSLYPLDRAVSS